MIGTPDEDLLRQIAAGDQAALAEFYDRHAPRTLGLLKRWLGGDTDAEDVLQEVFWQVWRSAGRYDPCRASPAGWLFLMARSRAVDSLRQRRPHPALDHQVAERAPHNPHQELERHESVERLNQAMTRLPGEQYTAIMLAFFGGLTYDQVAERAAIPVGTAKTRIRLGIRRLRDDLRE